MSNLREFILASQQMESIKRELFRIPDLQQQFAPALSNLRAFDSAFANFRSQMEVIEKSAASLRVFNTSMASQALHVSQTLGTFLKATRPSINYADIIAKSSIDWQRQFRGIAAANLDLRIPLDTHFARLYELSTISEMSLASVKASNIGSMLGINDATRAALTSSHARLGIEYQNFFGNITSDETSVVAVPQELSELPAVEYLNQTALVVSTSEGESNPEVNAARADVQKSYGTDTSEQLVDLLGRLNPEFPQLLFGARSVLETRHADYVRHFAVSLRELFTQVLHQLAPDDHIRAWSTDAADFHEKRPTRRARLRYITRHVQVMYGGFLEANVDSALKFIDAFQKGTHGVRPNFTPEEVLDLQFRMEGLIRFLIFVDAFK